MKTPARSFKELIVWQKARQLVPEIYRCTRGFPSNEKPGLTSQSRPAAVSVPANIAEGFSKRSSSDKARLFNVAQGSLEEGHNCLIWARDLGYGNPAKSVELYDEAGRLLSGYTWRILASNF